MIKSWPYILLIVLVSILLILRKQLPDVDKKKISFIICLILIVFSGFRYQVGTDYVGYSKTFDMIAAEGRFYNIEWGFYWLVKLIHYIGGNAQLLFLIFSGATIYFVYLFIEHFSKNVELSWFLFLCIGPYYLSTFNGVRQWLAIAIFAYSLKYIAENRFKKYAIINCIAGLFHYSSFILIPLYFILKSSKLNLKKIILCYVGFQLLSITGIIQYIAKLLHGTSYISGSDAFQLDITYYAFFIMSIVCWMYFLIINDSKEGHDHIFENLNLCSCLTVFLAISTVGISNMVFTRFNQYFFIGYIILVPHIVNTFKKNKTLVSMCAYVLSSVYYFILTYNATDLTPYAMNFSLFS